MRANRRGARLDRLRPFAHREPHEDVWEILPFAVEEDVEGHRRHLRLPRQAPTVLHRRESERRDVRDQKVPPLGGHTRRPASRSAAPSVVAFAPIRLAASSGATTPLVAFAAASRRARSPPSSSARDAASLARSRVAASASSAMDSKAAATPSCSGVGAQYVVYECRDRIAATSAGGPTIHPTRHPERHSNLLDVPMVRVRSRMPGASAMRATDASPKTQRSYTSSATQTTSRSAHRLATAAISSGVNTAPVGLCGLL